MGEHSLRKAKKEEVVPFISSTPTAWRNKYIRGCRIDWSLVAIFETLGLSSNDFRIRLSDRSTWVSLLNGLGVSVQARPAVLNAIDKSGRRKPEQTMELLNEAVPDQGESLWQEIQNIKKIDSLDTLTERLRTLGSEADDIIKQWKEMLSFLSAHGAEEYISIDLSIVRGLAYYTGFVYEAFEASGKGRALAGAADMITWFKNFPVMDMQLVALPLEI